MVLSEVEALALNATGIACDGASATLNKACSQVVAGTNYMLDMEVMCRGATTAIPVSWDEDYGGGVCFLDQWSWKGPFPARACCARTHPRGCTQVIATVYVALPTNNGGTGKATQITSLTVKGEGMLGSMVG